ncbi:hypothetical protein H5410_051109 [Solanum commersonii]|uniref:Uncharacterized protein n=1 Tax=Solanum commersonii TaxID=4109 RepID=A0A9J5WXH7_SOLCO|nr:hypothetical protein H5410_051109 [Solanum commersonii]
MVRTRTSASGDHKPIPTPASGSTILAFIERQVPIATQGRDMTVPPDADVIHRGVQDCVEGDGPAQAPPNIIATPVLQDTLTRDGLDGNVPVTSDASQTRVGGQTPDPMVAPDSQTPRTQPAATKVVDAAKELEMIRREGLEQREGKRTHHSGDYGGALPRSQGYLARGYHSQSSRPIHAAIPASEASYAGHSSSSWVHTSQGSSSRPVGCGGHSGHSDKKLL